MRRACWTLLWTFVATIANADEPAGPTIELPPVGAAPRVEDLAPSGPSVEARLDEIRRRVQEVVAYPPIARARGLAGEARVAFELGRDGSPHGIETVRSSGSTALDRAAERAVSEAAPLPWVYGRITGPVRFALRDAE